jgi:hypothetical protein
VPPPFDCNDPRESTTVCERLQAQEKARQAKRGNAKPGRKPRTPLVEGYVAPSDKPRSAGEPDVLLALEAVKELVSRFGADRETRSAI